MKMNGKISPSMMCADLFRLRETLDVFEKTGIEYLHVDVMDGRFVPNFTLGTDYCAALKKASPIPLDLHLMVERPEEKLDWFPIGKGDLVSVHAESTNHLQKVLTAIRAKGAKAAVALNPATPLTALEYVADCLDAVLVMTVNPGFAGQKLVPATLRKITDLREWLAAHGCPDAEIEVDGNVSYENARLMREAGADVFVAGTSSVFRKDTDLESGIRALREAIASLPR